VPSSLPAIRASLEAAPKTAGSRLALLLDWARRSIDDAIDSAGLNNITKQADELYDAYVAPLDIPGVPDFVERTLVDPAAKRILTAIIRGFYDLVDDEDDEPADTDVVEDGELS
jgi:hypothetical protein